MGFDLQKFITFLVVGVVLAAIVAMIFGSQLGISVKIGIPLMIGMIALAGFFLAISGFNIKSNFIALVILAFVGLAVFFILKGPSIAPSIFSVTGTGITSSLPKLPWYVCLGLFGVGGYFIYKWKTK